MSSGVRRNIGESAQRSRDRGGISVDRNLERNESGAAVYHLCASMKLRKAKNGARGDRSSQARKAPVTSSPEGFRCQGGRRSRQRTGVRLSAGAISPLIGG